MASRKRLLLAVAVGVALIGGSVALDATTPDTTYTYEVRELPASHEDPAETVVDDTMYVPEGPSAVFIVSSGSGDQPERTALREATNGYRTKAGFPGSLVDHQYAVVGTSGTFSEVSEVYRLREHEDENDETVRITAERITLQTFYDELAVSAAADPQLQELVRTGELTTHDRLTAVLVAYDGQYYHVIQPPLSVPYTGVRTDIHDGMDALGRGIALLAGGWYILERWGKYVWEDGPDILR